MSNYREMLARTDPWPAWQRPVLTPEQISRNREIAAIQNEQARARAVREARLFAEGQATTLAAERESLAKPYRETVEPTAELSAEMRAAALVARREHRKLRNEMHRKAVAGTINQEQVRLLAPEGSGLRLRSIRPGMAEMESSFNLSGARSIRAATLWPATVGSAPIGTSPLPDVTGAGRIIGLWENDGGVLAAHSELGLARVDTSMDNPVLNGLDPFQSHATGVAAIIIGAGNQAAARGTAYGASLESYDNVLDYEEMADAAAAGMHFSNHSYGVISGWIRDQRTFTFGAPFGQLTLEWRWMGRATGTEDPGWGLYERSARQLDVLTNAQPYYLPVYAAGNFNQLGQTGPVDSVTGTTAPTTYYYRIHDDNPPYGPNNLEVNLYTTTTQNGLTGIPHQPNGGIPEPGALTPSPDPAAAGYMLGVDTAEPKRGDGRDTLRGAQVSKNALTVGAVEDLDNGVTSPGLVKSAIFSSRGPTDDGRIKPDIVANGTTFTSATSAVQATTNLPSNASFESPVLADNTATATITGWLQDAGTNAAEIRREQSGRPPDGLPNHLVIKSANHRVYQDFAPPAVPPATVLAANAAYTIQLSIGRKTLSGAVGTDAGNVTKIQLYAGASGANFGTLVKEWQFNASTYLGAPVAPQTIVWGTPELDFTTGATPPPGTLRLVLQNAGTGYSYFDFPRLNRYSSTALTTSGAVPANPSFEAPVIATNNTSSTAAVSGWAQDTPTAGAEVRREDAGIFAGVNHLVIKNLNYRVWQDFAPAVTAPGGVEFSLPIGIGRKAWNAGAGTGTSPANLSLVRLYSGASGANFGTLRAEWALNINNFVAAPPGGQTLSWFAPTLVFTPAAELTGLRLVLENAGPGHSYFDFVPRTGLSGTSMAAPTITGGLALLQQMQEISGGTDFLSSTWKALLIHTAEDATTPPPILGLSTFYPGPDFIFGYGVVNIEKAANLLAKNLQTPSRRGHIRQFALHEGKVIEWSITCDGTAPLRVVLAHTDPAWQDNFATATSALKGVPDLAANPAPTQDDAAARLVNDLDLEVVAPNGAVSYPYKLNAAAPTAAATTGNNNVDNTEQVIIAAPAAGTWTLRVRHEGNMVAGSSTLKKTVKLLPGQAGYGTPDADDPLTAENEATLPRYRLDSGGVQPFSLIVDGNKPSSADALRITNYGHTVAGEHSMTWQSTKGVVYLVERSFNLQTWETRTAAFTWVNLVGNPSPPALFYATASTTSMTINVPPPAGTNPRVFYRIREAGLP